MSDEAEQTKVYKLEMMFIDFDEIGPEALTKLLENARLPNHISPPTMVALESRDVEWDDDHPLNNAGWEAAFAGLFQEGGSDE